MPLLSSCFHRGLGFHLGMTPNIISNKSVPGSFTIFSNSNLSSHIPRRSQPLFQYGCNYIFLPFQISKSWQMHISGTDYVAFQYGYRIVKLSCGSISPCSDKFSLVKHHELLKQTIIITKRNGIQSIPSEHCPNSVY